MITDYSNHAETLKSYNDNIPRLQAELKRIGVKMNLQVAVHPEEIYENNLKMKNQFAKKYYGIDDIEEVYNFINSDEPLTIKDKDQQEFYKSWREARGRQLSENSVALSCKWAINYDPVSKLALLIKIAIEADNPVFDYTTEDKLWLGHNLGYIPKIGYTSQYYPSVLAEANKAYRRTGHVKLTDAQIAAIARAIKEQQDTIIDMSLTKLPIEKTHAEATEKNNKAAESWLAFRNQKKKDVKKAVLDDAKAIIKRGTEKDIFPYNEQHRIQKGGNVILDYANIKLNDNTGKVDYTFEGIVSAIHQIASERGSFLCYYEDEPIILPELTGVITYHSLPSSGEERMRMIETGEAPAIIKRRFNDINDWQYKYVLECPNVFTLVGDKYPTLVDFADKIYTKHRSVKASAASIARIGQMFLYPFMEARKRKLMKNFSSKYSLIAQWTHPDNLKQLFTDSIVASVPQVYEGLDMSTTYTEQQLKEFREWVEDLGMITYTSSDDKTGFDTLTKIYMIWAYFVCFLSIPYEMDEENVRLLRLLYSTIAYPVVFAVNGIEMYSEIIPSGAFCTSDLGTFCSNTQTIGLRFQLAGCLDVDGINALANTKDAENDDDDDDLITVVGGRSDQSDSPADFNDTEA